MDDNKYTITFDTLPDDRDSEYNYEEVPVDVDGTDVEGEEDLKAAVRVLQEAADDEAALAERLAETRPVLVTCPPSVDDFVRSFLLKIGLHRTLDTFQAEFFELRQKGQLNEEDLSEVPDIYARSQQLDDQLKVMRYERDKYKAASSAAREMYVKLRNERDFHRMNHRRVVQEKNRLIDEVKILKRHYSNYEPALANLRHKYELAMKEKMLSKLERDRAMGQVAGLQSTLKSLEQVRGSSANRPNTDAAMQPGDRVGASDIFVVGGGGGGGVGGKREVAAKQQIADRKRNNAKMDVGNWPVGYVRHQGDTDFPKDSGINPALANGRGAAIHLTRSGGLKLAAAWTDSHSAAVSCIAVEPNGKQEIVTAGDDAVWKVWDLEGTLGECRFSGEGHSQWISSVNYHPTGQQLVTAGGDSQVKLWDLHANECVHSFTQHNGAVWCVQYHWTGEFIASSSMDSTIRIFDLGSLRCRQILRGHAESVNSVMWLPHGNLLLSSSADKTLMLWDPRVSAAVQTYYGHLHSINSAAFSPKGDCIASCDSFGFLKIFDTRASKPRATVDLGPHPANAAVFDPSASVIAVASNDASVKMVELANCNVTKLEGHEDSVQFCTFDIHGDTLFTAGSDHSVRVWN